MTEIEVRTEKVATMLAKERGMPRAMRELMLAEAYDMLYFGDAKKFEALERAYDDANKKRGKK